MVEWKKLGEIGDVCMCKRIMKNETSKEGEIPFYKIGTFGKKADAYISKALFEDYRSRFSYPKQGDILISAAGTIGRSVIFNGENAYFQDSNIVWINNNESIVSNRFLFYIYQVVDWKTDGGTIKRLYNYNLKNTEIPIPPLSEQNRIVGILDTFTESIENLKNQITERKKQYEHYRDQLLDIEGKPGVEMKAMGEIGSFIRGSGIQKSDFVEKGFPCIHYGQVHTKYGLSATSTISFINESLFKKCKKAVKGDIVIATTSEDAEGVAKPVAWLGNEEVAISGDAYIFHHNQNGKFMAHQFVSHRFMLFKIKYSTGTKVVRISGDSMAKFIVPLPSLSEQQRIVSILDTFEASIANLEQQLSLRQKQYEYYRNMLLTFDE